jgi:carboxyl-terminal processing protease
MKHRNVVILVAVAVVALATGGWLLQRESSPAGSVYQQARLFDDVLARVADFYVDSLDEKQLYQMAIDGLLDRLHDPYSTFLKPDDFRALSEATTGDYGGLGIQIDVRNGFITVVAPLPDTPAERAGILTGDQIIQLDDSSTEGWKNDRAVKELRGQPGSTAVLRIHRVGVEQAITFKLTRATIHIRSVGLAMMLDDRVGYIAMSPVSQSSAAELTTAITDLMQKGMKSLILDLRGNPGGLLNQGIAVSDLFLDPGQEVVATRGRAPDATHTYRDTKTQQWPQLPIVVVANGGTASAAEIIAGALQDHDRAILVGTPTFGKGLVQSFWQLGPNYGLKLTTARWYTPSGRTIQRVSKSEQDQEAQVLAGEIGKDTVPDSLVFHTDRGRIVRGGGGIRPDIFVAPDTFTTAERAFMRALGNKVPTYWDVRAGYALELKAADKLSNPAFTVSGEMVDEVLRRLHARGVAVPDSIAAGARHLIAQELTYEAARYVFGRPVEFRRRVGDDHQIQQALTLARRAKSPADLLSFVTRPLGAPPPPSAPPHN